MSEKSPPIGIDLGTTYSCVAVMNNGKVDVIPNEMGERTTPSMVAFTESGTLIGDSAKFQITKNPLNTIYNSKRLIGRKYDDPEIEKDKELYPFQIIKANNNQPKIRVKVKNNYQDYLPEQISSMILSKLKNQASNYLEKTVTDAIITVPAYFNDAQRQATQDAGKIAGLNVLRIINEPTAAAIAYGLDKKFSTNEKVLIFDLGGGTFDVSVLELSNDIFEVLATKGDMHLGGEDFDNLLLEYCIQEFKNQNNLDIKSNLRSLKRLKNACEKLKRDLSSTLEATIDIDSLMNGIDFSIKITRADFESLCMDLFNKCIKISESVLEEQNINKNSLNEIILIGGSSRIPKIIELVKTAFNGKEPNRNINPDEAVAYGAAVQAAIVGRMDDVEDLDLVLLDVTPKSLGIKVIGDKIAIVVPKYSKIPIKKVEKFCTIDDYQESVVFDVYEGEFIEDSKKNYFLGSFHIENLPLKKKGEVEFDVTFEIDVNSILTVTAVETSQKLTNYVVIVNDKGNLSKDEIEKLKREANAFQNIDTKSDIVSTLQNLKLKMIYAERRYNESKNNKEKIESLETLIKCIEEYLISFNPDEFENISLLEKYLFYLNQLIKGFYTLLSIKTNIQQLEIDNMKIKLKSYMQRIHGKNINYLVKMLEKLQSNKRLYYSLMVYVMRLYFNEGLKKYDKKEYDKSKSFLKESQNVSELYNLRKENLNDEELLNEIDDILESCNFYIKRINANQLMKIGEEEYYKGIYDSEHIDMDSIYSSLDKYREALKEIVDNSTDLEYEAICLSKIVTIQYNILKSTKIEHINQLAMQCLTIALSIHSKNVEEEKWYKDVKRITEGIRDKEQRLENENDEEFKNEMKKRKPEIFEEIENKFKESNLTFIKFILEKYPYKGYTSLGDIDEKFKNEPQNLLKILSAKYHPDRYKKTTNEEKEIFTIMTVISPLVNNIYSIFDNSIRKNI